MNNSTINSILEAIKNPANYFDTINDFFVEKDSRGEVLFFPSNFAVTFRVEIDRQKYAMKCYLQHVESRKEHFDKLEDFFKITKKDYFVDYRFLANELTIYNGNDVSTTDILLLPWIEGRTLHDEIFEAAHFGEVAKIENLRKIFTDLVKDFNDIGFVHGDLKPQNIIFEAKTNSLKIIDYDASWIQSISHITNNEIGTFWYQHPERANRSYGAKTDNYSIVLIIVSLMVIEKDTHFFEKYYNGENIIFSPEEIVCGKSAPFRELQGLYAGEYTMLEIFRSLTKPCPYSSSITDFLDVVNEYNSIREIGVLDVIIDEDGVFRRFYNKDKLYGFVDKDNIIRLEPHWENAECFENGYALVRGGAKTYFVDNACCVSSVGYDEIVSYNAVDAVVCLNGLCGLLSMTDFTYIIKPRFLTFSPMCDGVAVVSDNTGYYLIDGLGCRISSITYCYCSDISAGYCVAKIDEDHWLIDDKEHKLCVIDADKIIYVRNGMVCMLKNNVVFKENIQELIK